MSAAPGFVQRAVELGAEAIELRPCTSNGQVSRDVLRSWPVEAASDLEIARARASDAARLGYPCVYAVVAVARREGAKKRLLVERTREAPTRNDLFAESPTPEGITSQVQRFNDGVMKLHAETLGALLKGHSAVGEEQRRTIEILREVVADQQKQMSAMVEQAVGLGQRLAQETQRIGQHDVEVLRANSRAETMRKALQMGEKLALPLIGKLLGSGPEAKPEASSGSTAKPEGDAKPEASSGSTPKPEGDAKPAEAAEQKAKRLFAALSAEQRAAIAAVDEAIGAAVGRGDVRAIVERLSGAADLIPRVLQHLTVEQTEAFVEAMGAL